jgi:hypothetical protein
MMDATTSKPTVADIDNITEYCIREKVTKRRAAMLRSSHLLYAFYC